MTSQSLRCIQPEIGLPFILVRTMTEEAILGQNRTNVSIEFNHLWNIVRSQCLDDTARKRQQSQRGANDPPVHRLFHDE